GALRFALLSDWTDCAQEHAPDDEALLTAARAGIAELNRRHGASGDGEPRFYLFHRRRLWSESEGRWMGWERKRGKLHELNRLLRGATDTSFMIENLEVPASIRFVITLDADTQLPRGAAARLVGTLAHPLNRPRLEPREGRVVEGYGILQPRIAPTLPTEREGSLVRRVFSGARQHRWARGDWQLLPWLIRGAAGVGASRARIPTIGRWKMLDNLRRTLSAPAAYLTLVLSWALPPAAPLVWTKLVLLCLALSALVPVSTEILPRRPGGSKRAYLRGLGESLVLAGAQIGLSLTFLAHQAWLMGDAVVRTLLRLAVTRRRMLEWVSAAQVK